MSKEQSDIVAGNKLIAEFMEEENISAIFQTEPFVTEVRISYNMINELEKQGAEVRLYYHDNWNKLMPVVEKINKLAIDNYGEMGVYIYPYKCLIGENEHNEIKSLESYQVPLINLVWGTVVDFLTWYNQK